VKCSSESSHRSPLRCSRGLSVAWSAAPWRSMLTWIAIVSALLALASASGCGRTVLVKEGSPIRIGPDAKARVYVLVGGEWTLSNESIAVPEGWYLVSPEWVDMSGIGPE
jgi:hypothetical protein